MSNPNYRDDHANVLKYLGYVFSKKRKIKKGDLGIYHYVWACDTVHEDSHGLKYDIYAKIKAVEIYENMVEIEMIDIKINDSASSDIQNIIKNNFPKYVNPRYVKWQVEEKTEK